MQRIKTWLGSIDRHGGRGQDTLGITAVLHRISPWIKDGLNARFAMVTIFTTKGSRLGVDELNKSLRHQPAPAFIPKQPTSIFDEADVNVNRYLRVYTLLEVSSDSEHTYFLSHCI